MPTPGSFVKWRDKIVWYVGPYKATSGELKQVVIRDEHDLYVVMENEICRPAT